MLETKRVTGRHAGIGTVVFGFGLGLVLTTLWGLRYHRAHRFVATLPAGGDGGEHIPACAAEAAGDMSPEDLLDQLRRRGLI